MHGSLCIVNIPFVDNEKMKSFYEQLLGYKFAPSLTDVVQSDHMPISRDGIFMTLTNRRDDREGVTCYFGVKDLVKAIEELIERGGKLLEGPFDMPIAPEMLDDYEKATKKFGKKEKITATEGKTAIMQDPEGNCVGLLQLEEHVHDSFKVGKYHQSLTDDQIAKHKDSLERGMRFKSKRK